MSGAPRISDYGPPSSGAVGDRTEGEQVCLGGEAPQSSKVPHFNPGCRAQSGHLSHYTGACPGQPCIFLVAGSTGMYASLQCQKMAVQGLHEFCSLWANPAEEQKESDRA
ncbi:hypothetical protein NDU88_007989 [Pleurodeles waltl]|uniref:Uncharacterized protein n=1 Tax=Pleurodeles waltl TaxID=8319 RepID=A0AAV7NWF6_PLEWA|nr:hypothetical protein NDU88_007989 [Pleurodeles waltl]